MITLFQCTAVEKSQRKSLHAGTVRSVENSQECDSESFGVCSQYGANCHHLVPPQLLIKAISLVSEHYNVSFIYIYK